MILKHWFSIGKSGRNYVFEIFFLFIHSGERKGNARPNLGPNYLFMQCEQWRAVMCIIIKDLNFYKIA